jgi:hypothetical protein
MGNRFELQQLSTDVTKGSRGLRAVLELGQRIKVRGLTYVGYGTKRRTTISSRSLRNAIHDKGAV